RRVGSHTPFMSRSRTIFSVIGSPYEKLAAHEVIVMPQIRICHRRNTTLSSITGRSRMNSRGRGDTNGQSSFVPRFNQQRIQERCDCKNRKHAPNNDLVALAAVVGGAGKHGAGEAAPHIEEAHHPPDRSEIAAAKKIAHRRPNDGKGSVKQSEYGRE